MVYSDLWAGDLFAKPVHWLPVTTGTLFIIVQNLSVLKTYLHHILLLNKFDPEEADGDMGLPTRDSEEFRYCDYEELSTLCTFPSP
jgi:hypothetical protein